MSGFTVYHKKLQKYEHFNRHGLQSKEVHQPLDSKRFFKLQKNRGRIGQRSNSKILKCSQISTSKLPCDCSENDQSLKLKQNHSEQIVFNFSRLASAMGQNLDNDKNNNCSNYPDLSVGKSSSPRIVYNGAPPPKRARQISQAPFMRQRSYNINNYYQDSFDPDPEPPGRPKPPPPPPEGEDDSDSSDEDEESDDESEDEGDELMGTLIHDADALGVDGQRFMDDMNFVVGKERLNSNLWQENDVPGDEADDEDEPLEDEPLEDEPLEDEPILEPEPVFEPAPLEIEVEVDADVLPDLGIIPDPNIEADEESEESSDGEFIFDFADSDYGSGELLYFPNSSIDDIPEDDFYEWDHSDMIALPNDQLYPEHPHHHH